MPTALLFRNPKLLFFSVVLAALALIFFVPSCSKKAVGWKSVDPEYARYVEAYTTGVVSKTSSIRIKLAADVPTTHTVGQEVKEKLFSFTPSVKGKAYWVDARTIEFKPEKNLEADKLYERCV